MVSGATLYICLSHGIIRIENFLLDCCPSVVGTGKYVCFSPLLWHMPRLRVESILLIVIPQILGVWHDQDGSHHPWLYQWLLSLHAGELIFSWDNTVPVSCGFENLNSIFLQRIWTFAVGPYLGSEGDMFYPPSSTEPRLRLGAGEWSYDWVRTHNTRDLGVDDIQTWCWW